MTAKARAIVGRWYSIPLLLVVWGAAVASASGIGLSSIRASPEPNHSRAFTRASPGRIAELKFHPCENEC